MFFIIFCRFVFNLRDKDYWLFYKILSLFHFFNTNLNDIYFCGKLWRQYLPSVE